MEGTAFRADRPMRRSLDFLRPSTTRNARPPRRSMDFLRRAHSHHAAPFPATRARRLSARPDAPLYLFRAPGLQARVGLRKDVYAPGESVEGAVILYRDAESAAYARVAASAVDVHLYCEG